jgi:outer membrane protein with beta-barrel domain
LTPFFSLELDLSGSSHKSAGADISFGEFSLNGKYAFNATSDLQPFLFAGLGSFTLGDKSLTYGGSGYNLGLGLDIYSQPHLSWGLALMRKIIAYDRVVKGTDPRHKKRPQRGYDIVAVRRDLPFLI